MIAVAATTPQGAGRWRSMMSVASAEERMLIMELPSNTAPIIRS